MKTGGRADGNGGLVAGLGGVRTGEQITPPLGGCGGDAPSGYELCFWTIWQFLPGVRCTERTRVSPLIGGFGCVEYEDTDVH